MKNIVILSLQLPLFYKMLLPVQKHPHYHQLSLCQPLASTSASSHEDHEHLDPAPKLKTYKLVKDNIDKTIKPRRIDSQTQSLHYFHTYAVRNRIHVSHFSDRASVPKRDSIDVTTVLPKGLKNPVSPKKAHDFLYSVKV